MEPKWLVWARRMQALAQTGLAFTRDKYDRERFEALLDLAAEVMAAHGDTPADQIKGLFAAQTGYATPKVDVRGAAFRDGRILMVRESMDQDRWTLPGGWADVNDSPAECVRREVLEESGFQVRVTKLAAVWDRAKHAHTPPYPFHIYKMFFICEVVGGSPAAATLETNGVAFFGPDEVPADLSLGRTLPWQVQRMFAHAADPSLPTDFD